MELAKLPARTALLNAAWRGTHKDYRGLIDGVRYVMTYCEETGGSTLAPLDSLTEEQLKKRAGSRTQNVR